jgi:hypothetical protein
MRLGLSALVLAFAACQGTQHSQANEQRRAGTLAHEGAAARPVRAR